MELNATLQALLLLAMYSADEDNKFYIRDRLREIYDDLYHPGSREVVEDAE